MPYVYRIENLLDGKAYIGVASTLSSRWNGHVHQALRGTGFKLHAAMRKHGIENFEMRPIAELPTWQEAALAERIAIAIERPVYNLTAGGEGVTMTPEIRAKISAKSTGRSLSLEARAKIKAARARQANVGHGPFDAAHREKIRAANTGKKQSEETKAKRAASLRRAHAEGRATSYFKTAKRGPDGRCLKADS